MLPASFILKGDTKKEQKKMQRKWGRAHDMFCLYIFSSDHTLGFYSSESQSMASNYNEINTLHAQVNDLKRQLAESERLNEVLDERIYDLRHNSTNLSRDTTQLTSDQNDVIKHLNTENDRLRGELSAKDAKIAELEANIELAASILSHSIRKNSSSGAIEVSSPVTMLQHNDDM